MNILIDARLLSKGKTSGISGYTKELLQALFSIDKTNQYTLFYNGLKKQPLPESLIQFDNVHVLEKSIPNKILDLGFRTINSPKIEKMFQGDLIFSPHFNILPKTKIPRIVTFHDISFMHERDFFSTRQKIWHWMQNYKKQAQRAKKIVAVSEYTKQDLVDLLKIPEKKIEVIYSGISKNFKETDSSEYQKKNDLNKPFILYLGALEARKNIPLLIRAFIKIKQNPKFKDYELVLAGRPGHGSKEIFKLCKDRNDIRFFFDVKDDERISLYNLARVFVYPSFFEGFGFPPLEAQACGTPVIASDRTSLPEILNDSALFTDPWRVNNLRDLIQEIETNKTLRGGIIKRGLKNVQRFTWNKTAKQLIKVFEDAKE